MKIVLARLMQRVSRFGVVASQNVVMREPQLTQGQSPVICSWPKRFLLLGLRVFSLISAIWISTNSLASIQTHDFPFIEPRFELMRDADTIDDQIITALAQDKRGFLWIGTQDGLIRFDGYRYRKFTHDSKRGNSLLANYVYSLHTTSDGRIWVGTRSDGVTIFNPQTEEFEHPKDLSSGMVRAMAEDNLGGMWIGTEQGLYYRAKDSQEITLGNANTMAMGLRANSVSSLLIDKNGRLWVGNGRGLQTLSKDGKRFETVIADKDITALHQSADGKIWVGSGSFGAAWLLPNDARAENTNTAPVVHWIASHELSSMWIAGIAEGRPGEIWLATYGGGLNIISANDGRVIQTIRIDNSAPGGLLYDDLKPLLRDRSGWLWIGTWGVGLQRVNTTNTAIRTLKHSAHRNTGLSYPDVSSILELQDGRLLVGTSGNGIDIIDRQRGLIGGYRATRSERTERNVNAANTGPDSRKLQGNRDNRNSNKTSNRNDLSEDSALLPDRVIPALAQTADGSVWVGTQEAGLVRMRAGSKVWERIGGLPDPQVRRLLAANDGSVWIGTDHGVARWQSGSNAEVLTDEFGKVLTVTVFAIVEDRQKRVWLGSDQGLWVQEPGQKGMRRVQSDSAQQFGLVSDYIQGLLLDRRGQLWVNTDKGLHRLQHWDGRLAQFDYISGLLNLPDRNLGSNLLEDQQGRIWTEDAVIDLERMRVQFLGSADGVDTHTSWNGSFTKTRDGVLLFGGTKGIAIIQPQRFAFDNLPTNSSTSTSSTSVPIAVAELKINGQVVAPGVLAHLSMIEFPGQAKYDRPSLILTPKQRDFSIEFAALDFSDPKKTRYQYRLEGYDKEWIETDADHRSASYTSLWPGLYHLEVRASSRHGEWQEQSLSIPIRVLPAWWQTWWFVGLLLFILAGFAVQLLRWREQRLQEQAKHLQTLIDASTADILNISHIGRELTATLDTEQAFDRVHRHITAKLQTDVFYIAIIDDDNACLNLVHKYESNRRQRDLKVQLSELHHPAVWCVQIQEDVITTARHELANYLGDMAKIVNDSAGVPTQTMVFLPLFAGDKVIGCLSVQSKQVNAYSKEQLDLLRILASYAAIALSNSIAHNKLAKSNEELADALHDLKTAQAKLIQVERQQISLDLHDNLSQTMTGILLQLDTARAVLSQNEPKPLVISAQTPPMGSIGGVAAQTSSSAASGDQSIQADPADDTFPLSSDGKESKDVSQSSLAYLDRAIELARDGIAQTRYMLKQLRSKQPTTAPVDILTTLRRDLSRLTTGTPIRIKIEQSGHPIPLRPKVESAVLNVAQQGVTNALRHSGAKTIRVMIAFQNDHVVLTIRDDGNGFDVHSPSFTPGIGLFGMRQRVTSLAGKFHLATGPGKGTKVTASIPFLEEE